MAEVLEQVQEVEARGLRELEQLTDAAGIDSWRVEYLGKKGAVSEVLKSLRDVSDSERPQVGAVANRLRDEIESAFRAAQEKLENADIEKRLATERLDITLAGRRIAMGAVKSAVLACAGEWYTHWRGSVRPRLRFGWP